MEEGKDSINLNPLEAAKQLDQIASQLTRLLLDADEHESMKLESAARRVGVALRSAKATMESEHRRD